MYKSMMGQTKPVSYRTPACNRRVTALFTVLCFFLLAACAQMVPESMEPSEGHIDTGESVSQEGIPEPVQQTPVLPEPEEPAEVERYTVVVNEVPARELLFALARDAEINVDINPQITGSVTINAVDQTMNQILARIARQVALRYNYVDDVLVIQPDAPFIRNYEINYISQSREMTGDVELDTSIGSSGGGSGGGGGGGGGAGGGGSTGTGSTNVAIESSNNFWASLVEAVENILGEEVEDSDVTAYPESGILQVRATANKHRKIRELVDGALNNARRQVLIQATIAEVTLNRNYQAGIDWSIINNQGQDTQTQPQDNSVTDGESRFDPQGQGEAISDITNAKSGFDVVSSALAGTPVDGLSSFVLSYTDPRPGRDQIISATVRLLDEFGDVNILSTPQIMALNNQTAIMKVVDDIVYFEVDAETSQSQTTSITTFDTTPKTVSVGVTMSVTPQINANDSIILNIRPSISRVLRFVPDPNPQLTVNSGVPELRVREFETLMEVNSGQIAVLGGLMENNNQIDDAGTPGISNIPVIGELFKSRGRQYRKTELVIFLRPLVIRNPSLEEDFRQYKTFLEQRTGRSGTRSGG